MIDNEFWGEVISIYTDADAQDDGVLTDISDLRVRFNGKIINRMTCGAAMVLEVRKIQPATLLHHLRFIVQHSKFDGDGADAWGVFQMNGRFQNEKFWLVPNEVSGYTILQPSEY